MAAKRKGVYFDVERSISPHWSAWYRSPWTWAALSAALMVLFCVVAGYDGLYGQDAYGYLNDARALQTWLQGGAQPPDFFWTRGYSGVGAILALIFGHPHLPMLALSILSLAGTVAAVHTWARDLHPKFVHVGPVAFLLVGLSPFLFRNGVALMSDTWAIFWVAIAFWQGHRYAVRLRAVHLALAVFAAGAAVCIRYSNLPILLWPMGVLAWKALQARKFQHLPLLALALLPALPELLLMPGGPASPAHSTALGWSLRHYFSRSFVNNDGYLEFPTWNLLYILQPLYHPGFLGLGILGSVGIFLRKRLGIQPLHYALLIPVGIYLLFLGALPYQNARFLLPSLPILAVFSMPIWEAVLTRIRFRDVALLLAFGIHALLCIWGSRSNLALNRLERRISQTLEAHAGKTVYTFGMDPVLQTRLPELKIVSLYYDSIPLPRQGDLLLSDLHKQLPQWEKLAPGRNWRRFHDGMTWDTLQKFERDWILYARH